MIDTLSRLETPEGVELEFSPAGPVPRALAWLLDAAIRGGVDIVLASGLGMLGKAGSGLMLIIAFAMEWAYPVVFEVAGKGQTPGKRALNLRVVREDGAPVGLGGSMLRSVLAAVDFLPFAFGVGLGAMFLGRRFQRLGDLAAGTLVVHVAPEPGPARRGEETEGSAPVLPFPLTLPEQRAIMGFAERQPMLTRERAEELATILEPLTGSRGEAGTRDLLALARVFRGRG